MFCCCWLWLNTVWFEYIKLSSTKRTAGGKWLTTVSLLFRGIKGHKTWFDIYRSFMVTERKSKDVVSFPHTWKYSQQSSYILYIICTWSVSNPVYKVYTLPLFSCANSIPKLCMQRKNISMAFPIALGHFEVAGRGPEDKTVHHSLSQNTSYAITNNLACLVELFSYKSLSTILQLS